MSYSSAMETAVGIARASVKKHEGWRPQVYTCPAGYATIGYGRNLETRGVSPDEGDDMLENDLRSCVKDVNGIMREHGVDSADIRPDVHAVLLEMCYQLGRAGLRGFARFLDAVAGQRWRDAAREMLDSKWADQTPRRAEALAERVKAAAADDED